MRTHPPFFRIFRCLQALIEKVPYGISYLSRFITLGGILIVLFQGVNWLKTGNWRPVTLLEGLLVTADSLLSAHWFQALIDTRTVRWLVSPSSWLGFHRILLWILEAPLSLFMVVGGLLSSSAFTQIGNHCLLNGRLLVLRYMGFKGPTILGGPLREGQSLESETVGYDRSFEIGGRICEVTRSSAVLQVEFIHSEPSETSSFKVRVPLKRYQLVPLKIPTTQLHGRRGAIETAVCPPMFICAITLRKNEQHLYAAFAVDTMSREL